MKTSWSLVTIDLKVGLWFVHRGISVGKLLDQEDEENAQPLHSLLCHRKSVIYKTLLSTGSHTKTVKRCSTTSGHILHKILVGMCRLWQLWDDCSPTCWEITFVCLQINILEKSDDFVGWLKCDWTQLISGPNPRDKGDIHMRSR